MAYNPENVGGVIVDFGNYSPNVEETTARSTVNATWVPNLPYLKCSVVEGQDHTVDEVAAEQVFATIGNIIVGTSFDVVCSAPNGASGKFYVNWG